MNLLAPASIFPHACVVILLHAQAALGFSTISSMPSSTMTMTMTMTMPAPTPLIPPRFDNFCEQTVGTWSSINSGSGCTSNVKLGTVGDVEEVMRSCGGAVQGIREVAIPIETETSHVSYIF